MSVDTYRDDGATLHKIVCDICGEEGKPNQKRDEAINQAKEAGWRQAKDDADGAWIDICPECQGKATETETKAPEKPRGWNYPTEDQEQQAVIDWARVMTGKYPELELLHHIPNGGSRHKAEAVKLQHMGVKPGIPDLCLPVPKGCYHGLYIEMKRQTSWTLTDAQKDVISKLAAQGYYCEVCPGAEAAIKIITWYIQGARHEIV